MINTVISLIPKVRKAIVALVGVAFLVLGPDNQIVLDVVAVLTALGVYVAPNA